MQLKKYLVIIILLNLFLISLSANEKLIIENDNTEEILYNEIAPQFCFSLKINKFIKSNKNSLMTREDFFKKAGGYLFMGIIGVVCTSIAIPAEVGGTILLWFLTYRIELAVLLPFFCIFLPFVGIGVVLLTIGFWNYSFYKKQKIPNPFNSTNNYNEIVILKFNLMRKGA